MTDIVTQATVVTRPEWATINFNRNLAGGGGVPSGEAAKLQVAVNGSYSWTTNQYVGDANGVPMQALTIGGKPGSRFINMEEFMGPALFGEIVTRADGTKISMFDLMDVKLAALVKTDSATADLAAAAATAAARVVPAPAEPMPTTPVVPLTSPAPTTAD